MKVDQKRKRNCNRATAGNDKLTHRRLDEIGRSTWEPISERDIEAAWSADIERRLVEIEAGTVEFEKKSVTLQVVLDGFRLLERLLIEQFAL